MNPILSFFKPRRKQASTAQELSALVESVASRPLDEQRRISSAIAVAMAQAKSRDFIEVSQNVPIHKFSDYASYISAGTGKIWAVARACNLISSVLVGAQFKVIRTNRDTSESVLDNAKVGWLFNKPNPYDSWADMVELWAWHMELTGNCYWLKDEIDVLGRPTAIYPLMPQYMKVIPHPRKKISHYEYQANGATIKFPPSVIIHFRSANPASFYLGMGRIESAEPLYNAVINRDTLEEKYAENGAQLSGILTRKDAEEGDDEWAALKKKFLAEYAGKKNAGKTAMLNGDWQYFRLGLTPQEAQSIEMSRWTVSEIFLNHGVPLSIAGIENASNYACLPAGEMVSTPYGPTPIEELEEGDSIYQFDPDKGTVVVPVSAIIPQDEAEVLEFSTGARTLRASDNHPILCVERHAGGGNNGKRVSAALRWKRMDELNIGEMVVVLDALPDEHGGIPAALASFIRNGDDAAYVLGQYVGDGSGASLERARIGGFSVATHVSEGYQPEVAEAVRNGFGFTVVTGITSVRWNSAEFARAMVLCGFGGLSSTKHIPAWVHRLPYRLRLQFAAGLIDADGTVAKRGTMTFSVANKGLADGFRALLMGLGIPVSNLRQCKQRTNFGKVTNWRFTCGVPSETACIPLRHPKKAGRLRDAVANASLGRKNGKGVPPSFRLPEAFVLPDGYGVQRIRSIKALGKMPVYDLATVGAHTFIASGVVTHNTARQDEINFRRYKCVPMINKLIGTLNADGFLQTLDPRLRFAYDMHGLVDVEQIVKEYGPLVDKGAMTRNELRRLCNLPPIEQPNMDEFLIHRNYIPLERAGEYDTPGPSLPQE